MNKDLEDITKTIIAPRISMIDHPTKITAVRNLGKGNTRQIITEEIRASDMVTTRMMISPCGFSDN